MKRLVVFAILAALLTATHPAEPASAVVAQSPITVGRTHACAIVDEAAYCWGNNDYGQLGDGTNAQSSTPVAVAGLSSGVTAIDAALQRTCAVHYGAVKCWGWNATRNRSGPVTSRVPVAVAGLETDVTAIAIANESACAIRAGGAFCWGSNSQGQLGNGTYRDSVMPVAVVGHSSDVDAIDIADSSITGSSNTACALRHGRLKCWGNNNYGQLGDGTTVGSAVPVQVAGLTSGVTSVSTAFATCAAHNGAAKCWGSGAHGVFGRPYAQQSSVPVPLPGLSSGVTAVSAHSYSTCALASGSVQCWGGYAPIAGVSPPGPISSVTWLSAGYASACLVESGVIKCWGRNDQGQIGNGTTSIWQSTPVTVSF